jgi:glycosyltransferase involved in cell wall biosynthesis
MVAIGFPSPDHPHTNAFIGEQVRILCECVETVTVLSPSPRIPNFMAAFPRCAKNASLPNRYSLVPDRCEVLFPRYLKAPGCLFLWWTIARWRWIISKTVADFKKTHPVSIIHANAGSVSAWAGIQAARRHGIPSVVTYQGSEVHATLEKRQKGWELCRDSFRLASVNISVSRSLQDILLKHARPEGRYEVLLRGVDLTKFCPPGEGARKPIVLFVGRIAAAKGSFDLLAAWERVARSCPHAELWIVGPDQTKGQFVKEVRSRGLDRTIKLTGPVPSHEVANLMRASQVLCLPSHGEGTPNCVTEALATGLPVVATRIGGIPDVVQHNETGLLIDRGDVQGLAGAIVSLLQDAPTRARMGKAGRAFARQHLDARANVRRLVQLYEEAISSQVTDTTNVSTNRRLDMARCPR